ncbi:MAG: O-antigen ligase family protein [Flavobacteriia bacterium]|jgi:hypothetical protein
MLSRILGQTFVYKIIIFLYAAIAFALPYSKVVLSLATILLVLICLLELDINLYKNRIKESKIIQILVLFLLIHLLSFLWSKDVAYFLKDLNSKLPLYAIPLVLIFQPIQNRKDYYWILGTFLFSIFGFSVWNFIRFFIIDFNEFRDVRDMSQFLSHIRFGLMLVFGIAICFVWLKSKTLKFKFIPVILIFWFLIYTYFAEVFAAYLSLFGVFIIAFFIFISQFKKNKLYLKLSIGLLFGLLVAASFILSISFEENKIPKLSDLPIKTKEGNLYRHDLQTKKFINGHHVYSCYSDHELIREWNNVSKYDVRDTNKFGYEHYYILIQYMASKGLKKDAEDFKKLSEKDIANIESGKTNFLAENYGLMNRIQTIKDEFSDSDPNGKTLMQRIEYVKTGLQIFKQNILIGVGSGDLNNSFLIEYEKSKSKLHVENRLRAHNQILTYFISFGLIGGLVFCFFIFSILKDFVLQKNYLGLYFIGILLVSFLSEDTLETQVGGTLFAFFLGLFINEGKRFIIQRK